MDQNEVLFRIWEAYEAGELVTACAWCGRVRIEQEWFAPPPAALATIDATRTLSHSICPSCVKAQPAPKSHDEPTPQGEQPATG
jgi:hypothetical protein